MRLSQAALTSLALAFVLLLMGAPVRTTNSNPGDGRALPAATATATAAATPSPVGTVAANLQWKPVERDFDGVTMLLVPPGCFQMGSNDGNADLFPSRPTARVCFEAAYWIDKTEVTQAQFRRLGGKAANDSAFQGDKRPVEQITWFEARNFCTKRGARLPTEAEWEYAARGPDNLIYPWGNKFDGDTAVWEKNANDETADVGSRPAGASWVGALDLSGNVFEWVNSAYRLYPYDAKDGRENDSEEEIARVQRGGSWFYSDETLLRADFRTADLPSFSGSNFGFRCARAAQQAQ